MPASLSVGAVVSFHSACRFFSTYRWSPDWLGLIAARLIVTHLLDDDEPVVVAIDETMLKRYGRKAHDAFWSQDGSASGATKRSRGNQVVRRWHRRRPTARKLAGVPAGVVPIVGWQGHHQYRRIPRYMLSLLAGTFYDQVIHGAGDGAYETDIGGVDDGTQPPVVQGRGIAGELSGRGRAGVGSGAGTGAAVPAAAGPDTVSVSMSARAVTDVEWARQARGKLCVDMEALFWRSVLSRSYMPPGVRVGEPGKPEMPRCQFTCRRSVSRWRVVTSCSWRWSM